MIISEKILQQAIMSVLMENRKVLKVGNSAPSMPQMGMQQPPMGGAGMPPMGGDPNMGGMPPADTSMGGDPNMMGDPNMGGAPMDPSMGGDPNMGDGDSQFDTNFDAGVEADEESDPKHYIQQLTGKLSQSLNSFNNDNGPDAGLSKYVASMIIAAACKNLDDKAKKELIEKINSASSNDEDDMSDDEMEGGDDMEMGDEMPPEEQPQQQPQQQPLQERILTKRELLELASGMGAGGRERKFTTPKVEPKDKSIFSGKSFR